MRKNVVPNVNSRLEQMIQSNAQIMQIRMRKNLHYIQDLRGKGSKLFKNAIICDKSVCDGDNIVVY